MATYGGAPTIVTDGLVFAVDAANYQSYPGSGTTWSDMTGNGYNASLINGTLFNSENAGGLQLDGTNDDYTISNIYLDDNPFTLEIWFKFFTSSVYLESICHAGDHYSGGSTPRVSWGFGSNGPNNWYFQIRSGSINAGTYTDYRNGASLGGQLSNNEIVQFVGTKETQGSNTIINGYKNGLFKGTSTRTGKIFNLSTTGTGMSPNVLRAKQYTYSTPPPSIIYQIRLYNRVLSTSEISQNYNALKSRFGL